MGGCPSRNSLSSNVWKGGVHGKFSMTAQGVNWGQLEKNWNVSVGPPDCVLETIQKSLSAALGVEADEVALCDAGLPKIRFVNDGSQEITVEYEARVPSGTTTDELLMKVQEMNKKSSTVLDIFTSKLSNAGLEVEDLTFSEPEAVIHKGSSDSSVFEELVKVGGDRGVTLKEFEAIVDSLTFDYDTGFAHADLQSRVARDTAWCKGASAGSGYSFAAGIKIFMGQDLGWEVRIQLPGRTDRTDPILKSGTHEGQSLLQACGITGQAHVFLSHWQGELVKDTMQAARNYLWVQTQKYNQGKESCVTENDHICEHYVRFWLDYTTLNQNEVTWTAKPNLTKAMIQRPARLALVVQPWNDPMTLKRIWCCLEVGLHKKACHEVSITSPEFAPEFQPFRPDFVYSEDYDRCINAIDVEKAEATNNNDKTWVLGEIADPDGGYVGINEELRDALKDLRKAAVAADSDRERIHTFMDRFFG